MAGPGTPPVFGTPGQPEAGICAGPLPEKLAGQVFDAVPGSDLPNSGSFGYGLIVTFPLSYNIIYALEPHFHFPAL